MKAVISIYVSLSSLAILLCIVRPLGSPEFSVISWWPQIAALAGAVIILAYRFKVPVNAGVLMGLSFFLSAVITSLVSARNDLFISEARGIVTSRYIGGHDLKSIEIERNDGGFYRIEGLPESVWNSIERGQHVTKDRGTFTLEIEGSVATLGKAASIWRTEKPMNGEQGDGIN